MLPKEIGALIFIATVTAWFIGLTASFCALKNQTEKWDIERTFYE